MGERKLKSVLVADDDVQWHDRLKRRFSRCSSREDCPYEFQVDAASSLSEAIERIRARARENLRYDVVVFDLRMETELAGMEGVLGLGLSAELREELPVIIVFTGYPTYPTCVEAMRNRAWDYVVKEDVGDRPAAQVVVDSAVERLRGIDLRRELEQQAAVEWYPQHAEELREQYAGKIVALWHLPQVEVVASGADAFELESNLKKWRHGHIAWERPLILRVPAAAGDDQPAE